MKMAMTAVRSLVDVTRAMSANRAAVTPEPRPSQATHTSHHNLMLIILNTELNSNIKATKIQNC